MLSSSSLRKNKEVLTRNGGGKIGKELCLNLYSMVLLGNNTLRTSKLGFDLHVDFDLKEMTF
jgi:hypothetical protein